VIVYDKPDRLLDLQFNIVLIIFSSSSSLVSALTALAPVWFQKHLHLVVKKALFFFYLSHVQRVLSHVAAVSEGSFTSRH
jgi:hypothetical protein